MAKKILLVAVLLVVVAVGAATIFIATFDANKFKPVIIKTLQEKLRSRVELRNISLGWRGGIVLVFERFAVYAEGNTQGVPDLSLEKGFALLKLRPLLNKEIQVASIALEKPRVHIMRDAEGVVHVKGANVTPGKASSTGAAAASFLIDSIRISDGEVRYEDAAASPAIDVTIKKWDLVMENVSLVNPISFTSSMSIFSDTQNVAFQGKVSGLAENAPSISEFKADMDLGKVKCAELMKGIPSLKAAGITDGLAGSVILSADTVAIKDGKLVSLSARVQLKDGRVPLSALKAPIENIQIDATAQDKKITLNTFTANIAQASVKGTGAVENFMTEPIVTLNASTTIPKVRDFLLGMTGSASKIDGTVGLSIKGNGRGLDWPALSKTLTGSGDFSLENGLLVDTNIARQVIEKLSMFPALRRAIEQNIPASIKEKLDQDYTIIQPIKRTFTMQDGNMDLKGLKVITDLVEIDADTSITLEGMVSGKGMIRFQKDLSRAMLIGVAEMKYLANADNIVEFPVTYSIGPGRVSVLPDLGYIGSRLIAEKGQQILSDILNKASGEKTKETGQPANTAPQGSPKNTIGNFLKGLTNEPAPAQQKQ